MSVSQSYLVLFDKLMNPVEMYLEWEGGLQVDLPQGTLGSGDIRLMKRSGPQHMPLMTDDLFSIYWVKKLKGRMREVSISLPGP